MSINTRKLDRTPALLLLPPLPELDTVPGRVRGSSARQGSSRSSTLSGRGHELPCYQYSLSSTTFLDKSRYHHCHCCCCCCCSLLLAGTIVTSKVASSGRRDMTTGSFIENGLVRHRWKTCTTSSLGHELSHVVGWLLHIAAMSPGRGTTPETLRHHARNTWVAQRASVNYPLISAGVTMVRQGGGRDCHLMVTVIELEQLLSLRAGVR